MRVKLSANPPLPPLRAWFPLALPSATISTFKSILCTSLPAFHDISPSSLRLSIDGFELLDNSEFTVMRDGDLVCVDMLDVPPQGATTRERGSHATQISLESAVSRKRKRRTPTPSSSSSESEIESTTSSSESDSESTSDSDEDSRSTTPSLRKASQPVKVCAKEQVKPHAADPLSFVPPGYGKPQTRSRNRRRRLKRMHERETVSASLDGRVSGANAVVAGQVDTSPVDDERRDGHPALLSLSLRNKNKAKNFKSLVNRPLAPKIIFGDVPPEAATPECSTGDSSKPQTASAQVLPRLIPPSSRSSLPPNLFVTSVDVEAGLHKEEKKHKMRIKYGELEGQTGVVSAEDGDVSLDYGDDVDKATASEVDKLEAFADKCWAVLEKPANEKQIKCGMTVGYKALGINPVTHTPEQCLTVGRVVSCDSKTVVVRPLRAREQVSFGGPGGPVVPEEEEEEMAEEGHTWDDIIHGDWRLFPF